MSHSPPLDQEQLSERERAAERLFWLASFPEQNPHPIAEFEQDTGKLSYANPVANRLFPGLHQEGLAHPWLAPVREVVRGWGSGRSETTEVESAYGDAYYVQMITHLPDIRRVRVYGRDITERKRAELALAESEERFRTMANSIPQLAWIARADGFIFWYNRRWYEYTGTTPEQMEGWGWQSVHDSEFLPKVMEVWKVAIETGEALEMEFPLRSGGGVFRTFLTRVQPLKDADGRVVQWFGTNTDVEGLKQAEEKVRLMNAELEERVIERTAQVEAANTELRHSRAELNSLFESLPGLYLVLTPGLQIVAASDAYLKATMTTRAGLLGRGLFEVFPDNPDDAGATGEFNLRASLARVLQNAAPDTMAIQKYDIRRPDGVFEEHYWSPVNSPVFGADRSIKYIVHRVEDVTEFVKSRGASTGHSSELNVRLERMEMEVFQSGQRLQVTNQQLEAANQELEAFSYSVSHDLRAPLRSVDGFAQAMIEDFSEQLPEEGQRYLRTIREGAQRMGALIDDLLTFSRLSRLPLTKREVDVGRQVRDTLRDLEAEQTGRELDLHVGDLLPAEADPALLKQVWLNLISNALKYSRKRQPAVVEIGSTDQQGQVVYFVRDNGTGFDMRYASKLFGVFQRLHRQEDFEGTGVGLAIVQRIVHRHGGRVWVDAALDRGATFYFTLGAEAKL